jgi:zinc/manganese transport system permease protein
MSLLHEWFIAPFEYGFMQRGLLAAVLLGVSGGMLGCVLVLRRMILMGDALAHSLLPGLGLAWLLLGPGPWSLFLGALGGGLLVTLGTALISRLTRVKEDAAFAALFILCFAGGIALLSRIPTNINLSHVLFGHVLGVGPAEVARAAWITGLTVLAFVGFRRGILLETFDPAFHRATGGPGAWVHVGFLALTVLNLVAALQTMGIVLALGLFILPAVTAYLWSDHFGRMLVGAALLAVAGSVVGILLSYHAGLPSGAAIVLSLGVVFAFSVVFSPRHGLVARLRPSPTRRTHFG